MKLFNKKKMENNHRWSEEDDIVAFYLYRFKDTELPYDVNSIGKKLGMGDSSLKMRIANFKSIDGDYGLNHYSKQSKEIYKKYKDMPKKKFTSIVRKLIQ